MQNTSVSKNSFQLAYLILTHQFPESLARLVNRLNSPHAHFFIHVDRAADIHPFLQALPPAENVHFTDTRVKVHWRGFKMVEATLQLMKEAVEHEKDFKYCILLSGSDYPIKPTDQIQTFFERASLEYIHYCRLQDNPAMMKKVLQYYFHDTVPYDRSRKQPRLYRLLRRKAFRLLGRIVPRQYPENIEPYFGPQWCNLTGECVAYILNYVRDNPNFVRYYRYADAPDEMFIQTVVLNSSFAKRTVHYEAYRRLTKIADLDELRAEYDKSLPEESFSLRYIDFSSGGGSPATLVEDYFPALENSEALWARKVHPTTSAQLLDRIDTKVLNYR